MTPGHARGARGPTLWSMASQPRPPRNARSEAKRERIVGCAMRQFAEHGLPGRQDGGHRLRAGHREGLDLPTLRFQGRSLLRGLQAGREPVPRVARRARRGPGGGVLRHRLVLVGAHAGPRGRGLGPLSRRPHRQLRHRSLPEARHQSVHGERGPLRHARLRGVRDPSWRGPRRRRPRDGRLHGRLALRLDPGRPRHRGARPGPVPSLQRAARASEDARGALHDPAEERDRRRIASAASRVRDLRRAGSWSGRSDRTWSRRRPCDRAAPAGTSASTRGSRGSAGPRAARGTSGPR